MTRASLEVASEEAKGSEVNPSAERVQSAPHRDGWIHPDLESD